jgi:carbamoyltransferase
MNVLGISGRERDAAAALSIDGAIVAAALEESFARVSRIGYRHTDGFPLAAIDACLTRAGLTIDDVHTFAVVDDAHDAAASHGGDADGRPLFARSQFDRIATTLRRRERRIIPAAQADARQLSAVCDADRLPILVLSLERGESGLYEQCAGRLTQTAAVPAGDHLFCAVHRFARALGLPSASATLDGIERFASPAVDGSSAFDEAIRVDGDLSVEIDDDQFDRAIATLRQGEIADGLPAAPLERDGQALAGSFCHRLNAVVIEIAQRVMERAAVGRLGIAGGVVSSGRLVTDLTAAFGDRVVLPAVPEASGRALGAALPADRRIVPLESLALGPQFSEQEIKSALENCRLDYLYEPDWTRLLTRVSAMLARGTVVAWFQEAMGFGPRPIGTRAILCDPSNRWARENINRFLRRAPLDEPLPVAMTASALRESLSARLESSFLTSYAEVRPECRGRLRAAVDQRQSIPVQVVTTEQSPMLSMLLDLHRQRTGAPGLIQLPFCAAGEPPVCTPRDAVRTVFSSATDALVIGRFLLMKDYWMLRSGGV